MSEVPIRLQQSPQRQGSFPSQRQKSISRNAPFSANFTFSPANNMSVPTAPDVLSKIPLIYFIDKDVLKDLCRLDPQKLPGFDDIPATVLKNIVVLQSRLTNIQGEVESPFLIEKSRVYSILPCQMSCNGPRYIGSVQYCITSFSL